MDDVDQLAAHQVREEEGVNLYQIFSSSGLVLNLIGFLTLCCGIFVLDKYVFEQVHPNNITENTFQSNSNAPPVTSRIMFTAVEQGTRSTRAALKMSVIFLILGSLFQITAVLIF